MKTDANWSVRLGLVAMVLTVVFAALSCGGGGGGTVDIAPNSPGLRGGSDGVTKGTGVLEIREDQIATLPAWQQELLSDPGWNQPYIEPRAKTEIDPPTREMLLEDYARVMEEGIKIEPRGLSTGKSASYVDQGGFVAPASVMKGEYDLTPRDVIPPYGCNEDGSNGVDLNAFEDVIRDGVKNQAQTISYVLQDTTTANWFNTTGGSGNDAQSAVYQLFASAREARAEEWDDVWDTAEFEELCYRADLAPGVGPGGDCSAATAYLVTGMFWKRFNSEFTALPNLTPRTLFNVLIAPSSAVSALETHVLDPTEPDFKVDGRYQEFYFGTVSECYGGSMIVGLESAATDCELFDFSVNNAYSAEDPHHFTPIYGVLLKRWQQAELDGMDGPWDSWLGWPVWGPKAYANGSQMLTPRGAYYAWGLWFERGFMWWIDYDQVAYPNTPDEAQVFVWAGQNVFCPEETGSGYQELPPTVYYGGSGELGASVVVDSYRYDGSEPWKPVDLSADGTYYEIALEFDGHGERGDARARLRWHAERGLQLQLLGVGVPGRDAVHGRREHRAVRGAHLREHGTEHGAGVHRTRAGDGQHG